MRRRTRRAVLAASGRLLGGLVLGGTLSMARRATAQQRKFVGKKVLVAYYSRTGHTARVARMVHGLTGGDLVEIRTVEPYPTDYDALVAQNVAEQQTNYLPPLQTNVPNILDYDIVLVGSPIWNVRLTPPVRSFLSRHDLSRRTVAPFVTYIVSRLGRVREDILELYPSANLLGGLAVLGEAAGAADGEVSSWLAGLRVD